MASVPTMPLDRTITINYWNNLLPFVPTCRLQPCLPFFFKGLLFLGGIPLCRLHFGRPKVFCALIVFALYFTFLFFFRIMELVIALIQNFTIPIGNIFSLHKEEKKKWFDYLGSVQNAHFT